MALRIPPGRAGRTWLIARLDIARRGADLIDRKRQILLHEQTRARAEAEAAQGAWLQALAQLERWNARARMLDGQVRLEGLQEHAVGEASLELSWSNLMGARLPSTCSLEMPEPPPLSALGGSSAALMTAAACRDAALLAARHAAAERACAELSGELARANRRLRALRERWIPQHEQALARLDLELDESQREQATRVRWLTRRAQ